VPDAGRDVGPVVLDLLARAAAVAPLPAREVKDEVRNRFESILANLESLDA